MAMWDLYGGIAIKSAIGRLKLLCPPKERILIAEVKYIDWLIAEIEGSAGLFAMCVRKSESYRHEGEVRLLAVRPKFESPRSGTTWEQSLDELKKKIPTGYLCPSAISTDS